MFTKAAAQFEQFLVMSTARVTGPSDVEPRRLERVAVSQSTPAAQINTGAVPPCAGHEIRRISRLASAGHAPVADSGR